MRSFLLCLAVSFLVCCSGGSSGGDSDSQGSTSCSFRVVNGESCGSDKGPVVLLTLKDSRNEPIGICTGSLLTPRHVLTAAHCFVESGSSNVTVSSGSSDRQVSAIHIHPQYSLAPSEASPFDVAIAELDQSLDTGSLPLLLSQAVRIGDQISVAGYGQDENGDSATNKPSEESLRQGKMEVSEVEGGFLFAEFGEGQTTICSGDSGGPAVAFNHDGLPGIVGISNALGGQSFLDVLLCLEGTALFTDLQTAQVRDFILSIVPEAGVI